MGLGAPGGGGALLGMGNEVFNWGWGAASGPWAVGGSSVGGGARKLQESGGGGEKACEWGGVPGTHNASLRRPVSMAAPPSPWRRRYGNRSSLPPPSLPRKNPRAPAPFTPLPPPQIKPPWGLCPPVRPLPSRPPPHAVPLPAVTAMLSHDAPPPRPPSSPTHPTLGVPRGGGGERGRGGGGRPVGSRGAARDSGTAPGGGGCGGAAGGWELIG